VLVVKGRPVAPPGHPNAAGSVPPSAPPGDAVGVEPESR
jgi:hypothetical protein